ncbi:hypothetical protein DR864_28800 (plasmid) [Runella rosea]|uniref:Uncharacterized protein n=1 Tax=Runella rosea TaxID=2259595 RepID=A0A344TT95_9BACT|nr:hypothetical protein DR864_28800 [Runella rosea]
MKSVVIINIIEEILASNISTLKQYEFIGHFVDNFGEEFDIKNIQSFYECIERPAQKMENCL